MDCRIPERYTRPSFMDMLPSVITDEEMDAMKRHMQGEAMGLREHKCKECGREFVAHVEHRFKRRNGERVDAYCSYRCFRNVERKEEEAYRKRVMGAWVQREKTRVERARDRVKLCDRKLEEAIAKTKAPEWETLSNKRRGQIKASITHWRAAGVLAETELEEAMQECKE